MRHLQTVRNNTQTIKADKQRELQTLDEGLQKSPARCSNWYAEKQTRLNAAYFDKIQKNIEIVAKKWLYIILNPDLGGEATTILLYADKTYDISDLVLKKMGITPRQAANKIWNWIKNKSPGWLQSGFLFKGWIFL